MSIKTLVLAAAVAATGSVAAADSYFTLTDRLDNSTIVNIGTVSADAAGVVELYDFSRGEAGRLLGTTNVNAGANTHVRVNLDARPRQEVLAVLKIDGQVVAERQYDVAR